jgi:acyl-CoA dehydrogenase
MKDYSSKDVINESEKGIWVRDLWDILTESGMITAGVAEKNGGIGSTYQDALRILQIAGKYSAPIPLAETYMANWILAELGEQVVEEPLTVVFPKEDNLFRLKKDGDGWVISGKAYAVPWARFAQKMLIVGTTGKEYVLAVVRTTHALIEFGQNLAGEARDSVSFDHVHVNDCTVIPIDINKVKEHLLYSGAVTRTVLIAGAIENVLDITVQYTNERTQFGRPIHRFQAIQHQLSALSGEAAAVNSAADYAIEAYQKGYFSKEIAMAKMRASSAAGIAASIAHQVHGAIGMTYEHSLHQSTRRLWSWRDEFGTEAEWGKTLAKQLLSTDKYGLWDFLTGNKEQKPINI